MREIPILFNAEMIKAILDGRKTMTRRIVYPQPIIDNDSGFVFDGKYKKQYSIRNWQERFIDDWSRWMPEDLIWVKEAHYRFGSWKKNGLTKTGKQKWRFVADKGFENFLFIDNPPNMVEKNSCRRLGWYKRSPLFMPKEFARIWLEVGSIKLERVREISEDDILKEGVRIPVSQNNGILLRLGEESSAWNFMPEQWQIDQQVENRGKEKYKPTQHDFLFAHWAELWCDINGRESWDQNPYVWVIGFKILIIPGKPVGE